MLIEDATISGRRPADGFLLQVDRRLILWFGRGCEEGASGSVVVRPGLPLLRTFQAAAAAERVVK